MRLFLLIGSVLFLCSCQHQKKKVDLIVHHAHVYTLDKNFSTVESFAVKDGKIMATGKNDSILSAFESNETIDAKGTAIYPGFIDSHCHFLNYGLGLEEVDLVGTKSFVEVLQRVLAYKQSHPEIGKTGTWIKGRGWDQNDWALKEFPERSKLDSLFPDIPVCLTRIDGHAALVNACALKQAGILMDKVIEGGRLGLRIWEGRDPAKLDMQGPLPFEYLSGLLVDNAVGLVEKVIPSPSPEQVKSALLAAQKNCFAVGLTTVDEAGLNKAAIELIDQMQLSGTLKMRIYAMLSDNEENFNYYLPKGPYKTERLDVRSFKFYADGALGSRGACLQKPYSDKPQQQGFLLHKPEYYMEMGKKVAAAGFQMNTHAIGDSAVKMMLHVYDRFLHNECAYSAPGSAESREKGWPSSASGTMATLFTDRRWRIEHAQVADSISIGLFACLGVIPSVQPTHATSDMYWAEERLGKYRLRWAYAYQDLLKAAGRVALGTDFPVEDIGPIKTFYAAIARMDDKGFPTGGFQMQNALTREEALKGMTIWGAYANFEELEKGSLEPGKYADFVFLDKDIMTCPASEILSTTVLKTFVNGEQVYEKTNQETTLKCPATAKPTPDSMYADFNLSYVSLGEGKDVMRPQPEFLVRGTRFAFTREQTSFAKNKTYTKADTLFKGVIRLSSIDSIMNLIAPISDTIVYRTNTGTIKQGIQGIYILKGKKKLEFNLHHGSDPVAVKIIDLLNTYIPDKKQQLKISRYQ
jgi:predicted amidohydrolase YtcJ